ncbi:MAG: hypothetical protein FJ109_04065 [Deltaproteobacteria bacterium]|nr:hypothetical protein [Deltaproteobacteria bacterium]
MDKFKKLPPQYKLLIGIGFLGLVAGLYYYLVIMDMDDQFANQRNAYNAAQKELTQFKDFKGELEIAELREQYAQVIKQIEENKKIVPDKDNVPQLLAGLEADAIEAGLTVVGKEQKETQHENYYNRIPIQFEVSGSYLDFIKFLKLIVEPGKRLVAASNFDMKVVLKKKARKDTQTPAPLLAGGQVAGTESEIAAKFIVEGYTYTGAPAPVVGKKR